jgi:hypothetical protein
MSDPPAPRLVTSPRKFIGPRGHRIRHTINRPESGRTFG